MRPGFLLAAVLLAVPARSWAQMPAEPGASRADTLALPAGFSGHYCFDARAEVAVLRGRLLESGAVAGPPWSKRHAAGARVSLRPGVVYSFRADTATVVIIHTTAAPPVRREPGAPAVRDGRC